MGKGGFGTVHEAFDKKVCLFKKKKKKKKKNPKFILHINIDLRYIGN